MKTLATDEVDAAGAMLGEYVGDGVRGADEDWGAAETVEDVRIVDEVVDIDDDDGSGKDVASG